MKAIEYPKFKSYIVPNKNYGIIGVTLDLNLAQCQKLKDFHSHAITILNTPEDMLPTDVALQQAKDFIIELMPLLDNFKVFDSPNDADLF